jgi:hypothetical protein
VVFVPFERLAEADITRRFDSALEPPRETGVRWSMSWPSPLETPDAEARAASLVARQEAAMNNAADYADTIADIREAGIISANGIAAELNRRGGRWQALQVQRLLALLGAGLSS